MSSAVGSAVGAISSVVGSITSAVADVRQYRAQQGAMLAQGRSTLRQRAAQGRFDPSELPPVEVPVPQGPVQVQVPTPWGTILLAGAGTFLVMGGIIYYLGSED
jgi:hypothetical protein